MNSSLFQRYPLAVKIPNLKNQLHNSQEADNYHEESTINLENSKTYQRWCANKFKIVIPPHITVDLDPISGFNSKLDFKKKYFDKTISLITSNKDSESIETLSVNGVESQDITKSTSNHDNEQVQDSQPNLNESKKKGKKKLLKPSTENIIPVKCSLTHTNINLNPPTEKSYDNAIQNEPLSDTDNSNDDKDHEKSPYFPSSQKYRKRILTSTEPIAVCYHDNCAFICRLTNLGKRFLDEVAAEPKMNEPNQELSKQKSSKKKKASGRSTQEKYITPIDATSTSSIHLEPLKHIIPIKGVCPSCKNVLMWNIIVENACSVQKWINDIH